MRRMSIVTMMRAVALFAVELAALRNANEVWASVMLTLTLVVLGIAVLAVPCRRGRERIRCLGFVLFGIVYASLTFLPWFSPISELLATTSLLNYLNDQMVPEAERNPYDSQYYRARARFQNRNQADPDYQALRWRLRNLLEAYNARTLSQRSQDTDKSAPAESGFAPVIKRLRPGIEDPLPFTRIGPCLFTMLAGLVGAFFGSRLYRDPA
ncbi:hypothetical protein ACYOEI_08440 [Singulisphaera rosea]